jgi:hypothetical protein
MASGPIPISEVKAYCDFYGITEFGERKLFLRRMHMLDRAYLDFMEQKLEEQKKRGHH